MRLILVHSETNAKIQQREVLHITSGGATGQAWRYEQPIHHQDGHKVRCTRRHPKLGRIQREFHPEVFGCHIEERAEGVRDKARIVRGWAKNLAASFGGALWASALAWYVAEYGNTHFRPLLEMLGAR